jgi:integrase
MRRINTAKWLEKQNRWQIKVQKDNIRKTFTSSKPGREGQREAHRKADAWLDLNIISPKKKVKQTADEYIAQLKLTTSKSNYSQADYYFRIYINPKIGDVRVENITEQQLQAIINEAYAKKLSLKTLKGLRACIQSWLKFCRKSKYTTLFVEELKIPKNAPVGEKRILQPDDVKLLFASDKVMYKQKEITDLYTYAYRFQVAMGLRPGELVGLKSSDILDGTTLYIQRAFNIFDEETTGKNFNAKRYIELTEVAKKTLNEHFNMLADENIESDYIFPDRFGERLRQQTYYKRWTSFAKHNKITAITPYEMRHSFVSIVKTLPEGLLKSVVGHAKNMDTFGVYSHEVKGDRTYTAKMINDIFLGIINS